MLTSCASLKKTYQSEVEADLKKHTQFSTALITEIDIENLPEPVQRHFKYCGFIGKEKMENVRVQWRNVYMKMSSEKKWFKINCYQYNSVAEPTRIVYMDSRIAGIFPFEGRDKFQDGHGNMLIKLLKIFKVADDKSKEMDEAGLVTILSETFLVPTYAIQPYIKWTAVEKNTATATIKYNGIEVGGTFSFNDSGVFIRFESNDRYNSEKKKKVKWSVVADNYIEKNGILFPTELKAIWHYENGDFEYFKGIIDNITFNTRE